ncbi:hypothetical protein ACFL6O_01460 [candidate division KSB1 bacterium]
MDKFTRRETLKFLAKGAIGISVFQLISCMDQLDVLDPEIENDLINKEMLDQVKQLTDNYMKSELSGSRLNGSRNSLSKEALLETDSEGAWDTTIIVQDYQIIECINKGNYIEIIAECTYIASVEGAERIDISKDRNKKTKLCYKIRKNNDQYVIQVGAPVITKETALNHYTQLLEKAKNTQVPAQLLERDKEALKNLINKKEVDQKKGKNVDELIAQIQKYSVKGFFESLYEDRTSNINNVLTQIKN